MLDRLAPRPGSKRPRKRVGRGTGSGHGNTCGRGQKGAGSRSGSKRRVWSQGGGLPLVRRIPKYGFKSMHEAKQEVNVRDLDRFEANSQVDVAALAQAGLIARANRSVKLLGHGEISKPLTLIVDAVSASAKAKVEAAGGRIELVPTRRHSQTQKTDPPEVSA